MNPTKTAYYYRDTSGSSYQWSQQALTREMGQDVVDTGAAVVLYELAWCVIWAGKRKFQRTGL